MLELFSFLLILIFMMTVSVFLYFNQRRLSVLEEKAGEKGLELDTRMTQLIQGINYNDQALSTEQQDLMQEITLLETQLNDTEARAIANENEIRTLQAAVSTSGSAVAGA